MAPCRKIRFSRNQFLYVGDVYVKTIYEGKTDYDDIPIDRSKAVVSSVFNYCKQSGWFRTCVSYNASKNPTVTSISDGTWTLDLGKTYENLFIIAATNADKIELMAENDAILESYIICPGCPRLNVDPTADPSLIPSSWNVSMRRFYGEKIGPIIPINCINDKHWTGNIQKCEFGTNPDGCKGFMPIGPRGANVPFNTMVQPGMYRIVDSAFCNYKTLPGNVKVAEDSRDGCVVTYNKCEGEGCMKRNDGSLYFQERVAGCVDGKLSNWSDWKCIEGKATRTRECVPPLNGGKGCPNEPLQETAVCSDAKMTDWSDWSECDGSNLVRTRKCLSEPVNGGAPCNNLEEKKPCSNGRFTDWSEWSQCDGTEIKRTRKCLMPTNGGKPCPDEPRDESKPCSHGKLSEWSEWKCDGTISKRTRECIPPTNGGNPCPSDPLEETRNCSDGKLSDWSQWDCQGIKSKRTRECIPPVNGGKPCPNENLEEEKRCIDTKVTILLVFLLICILCISSMSIMKR